MKRKLVYFILSMCLTTGMLLGTPVLSYAKDASGIQTQDTTAASLWTYHITGQPGEQGKLRVDCNGFQAEEDLSNYSIKVVVPENCGVTFDSVSMENIKADEYGSLQLEIPYEIQKDFAGTSVQFSVQLLDQENQVIDSEERCVYPYVLDGDTLTYFDPERGSRYKITMDLGEHILYGDISGGTGGEYNVIPNGEGGYDYYLGSNEDSYVTFGPEEGYDIADVELVPADAGTVERMQLQAHGTYAVKLNAPAAIKVTAAQEVSLVSQNGVRLSVSSVTEEMQQLFDTIQLTMTPLADAEKEQEFKEIIGDQYADVELYRIEVSPLMEQYAQDLTDLIDKAKLTIPLPDNWDEKRSEGYYWGNYTVGVDYKIETTDDGNSIVLSLKNDEVLNQSATKAICTYALVQRSVPTEVKDWDTVAENYIHDIRLTDWFDGDEMDSHFYKETAPANDVAAVTLMQCNNKYGINGEFYNQENQQIEIPYDIFAADAAKYFIHVPDLTAVNLPYLISYQAEGNIFCRPIPGIGNAPLVTEVTGASDLGSGRYAIFFKVSNKNLEEGVPDMSDEDQYTECTLTVEDSGKGYWKYVSFEKGYTEGTPVEPEPSVTEELTEEQIQQAVNKIDGASAGSEVTVEMETATIVPQEILTAAKGKDVDVVLDMGEYSWIINGQDITDGSKDINLAVQTDVTPIPEDSVQKLAQGAPAKQIRLVHEGKFGFTATLRIEVGAEYEGKYGNLFWYTDDGKFTYIDTDKVDGEGYVSFTLSHASDYVIVLNDKVMSEKDIPADLQVSGQSTQAGNQTAPKTGDVSGSALPFLMLMLLMAGMTFVIVLRREQK